MTVTVNPVNDNPVASAPPQTTREDNPVSGAIFMRDVEVGILTPSLDTGPAHGTVDLNTDGTYTYTPNGEYNGPDEFIVLVKDDAGGQTRVTVKIEVTPVNDTPVGTDSTIATDEDTPVTGQIVATDIDGDTLTYSTAAPPSNGTVVVDPDGSYRYTPANNFSGTDSFSVLVDDGNGGTATVLVTVTVNPVNDNPVVTAPPQTTREDTPVAGTIVMSDRNGGVLTPSLETGPAHGTVDLNTDGTYTYTPDPDYAGSDEFTVLVKDNAGGETRVTVKIAITPVNDAPRSSTTTIATVEDSPVSGQIDADDVDGDTLTYKMATSPSHGTVVVNADGRYRYTPADNFNGTDSFSVLVDDGNGGTATIMVSVWVYPKGDNETPIGPTPDEPGVDAPITFDLEGEIRTVTDSRDGMADSHTVTGIVDDTANSVSPLNGISGLSSEGTIGEAVRQISDWKGTAPSFGQMNFEPFRGGSNMELQRSSRGETFFVVDTIVKEQMIYLLVATRNVSAAGQHTRHTITLADGRALPAWLAVTADGAIIGMPPIGTDSIDIRIQAIDEDGNLIEDRLQIQPDTGTITEHYARKRADAGTLLFSHQALMQFDRGLDSSSDLLAALSQGE